MSFSLNPSDRLCFSIIVTGRCNLNCSYCHFYNRHQRNVVNYDISYKLFELYLRLIQYIKYNYHHNIEIRFSGGDPLLLCDNLFILSKKVYNTIGLKPYILTNGKNINNRLVNDSIKNNIAAYLVSLENPFDVDSGSLNPRIALNKIKKYNSDTLAILPAVVIVRNHMFCKIVDICDFYYEEIGEIPTISELSFDNFQSPKHNELNELRESIVNVVKKYFSKAALELFPYIVPELSYCYQNKYLIELDLNNSLRLTESNIDQKSRYVLNEFLEKAYPYSNCKQSTCDWYQNCRRVKWIWNNKIEDYCKMKKTISDAYYGALAGEGA